MAKKEKRAMAGSVAMKACGVCRNTYPKRMLLSDTKKPGASTFICGICVDQGATELEARGVILPNKKRRAILAKMCSAYDRGLLREARR